jgi:endonuclease I
LTTGIPAIVFKIGEMITVTIQKGKIFNKHIAVVFLMAVFGLQLSAQVPSYYQSIDLDLRGQALLEELSDLITETHTITLSYTPGVWEAIKRTDLDPEDSTVVLLVYGFDDHDGMHITDRTRSVDLNCTQSDCTGLWNREHVVARAQANPSLGSGTAGTDVHNLRSADADMNQLRGNRKFAEGSSSDAHVTPEGNFYPGDEWAGDVARMLMYMYLRYGDRILPEFAAYGDQFFDPEGIMVDVLLEWNAADPVSPYEIFRNDILEELQGNRNPFIDNPYLATLIWEGPEADDRWMISSTYAQEEEFNPEFYPTPTRDLIFFDNQGGETFNYRVHCTTGRLHSEGVTDGEIDLSLLPASVYIIELRNESQVTIRRAVRY